MAKVAGTWSERDGLEGKIYHQSDVELIAFRSTLKEAKFVQMDKFDYNFLPGKWYPVSERFVRFALNDPTSPWAKNKAIETRAISLEEFGTLMELLVEKTSGASSHVDEAARAALADDDDETITETDDAPVPSNDVVEEGWPKGEDGAIMLTYWARKMNPTYELTSWTDFQRARVETKAAYLRDWMKKNNVKPESLPAYKESRP